LGVVVPADGAAGAGVVDSVERPRPEAASLFGSVRCRPSSKKRLLLPVLGLVSGAIVDALAPMTGEGVTAGVETARVEVDESAVFGLRTLMPDDKPPSRRVDENEVDESRPMRLLATAPQSSVLLLLLLG
jgi:hypothetical protein